MKFLHTMVRVKDIEKSLEFYTKLFNLELAKKMKLEDSTLYFLSDKEGYTQIELTHNDEIPTEGYNIGTGFGHFAFEVDSIDEFTKNLQTLGCKYLYEPFNLPNYNFKIAFVKDPDGYEVELIEKH